MPECGLRVRVRVSLSVRVRVRVRCFLCRLVSGLVIDSSNEEGSIVTHQI